MKKNDTSFQSKKIQSSLSISHQSCSLRKGVLRNFTTFTGKHLCQSLFFNKVACLWPLACNFIEKETLAQIFSCECCEISKNTFFTEHLWTTVSESRKESVKLTYLMQLFYSYCSIFGYSFLYRNNNLDAFNKNFINFDNAMIW